MKVISTNRRALHDYHVLDTMETGIVLTGTEIKSVRAAKVNFKDSYARCENGEVFLYGMHISPYDKGNRYNADPERTRKLLLHKQEIRRLIGKVSEKGMTLVPLKVYLKNSLLKVELGLVKGKRTYDKRQSIAKKDAERMRQVEEKEKLR